MAQIVTITNPLTGQPAQVDQLEHTAQEIDDAIARALPGGAIDITLQNNDPRNWGLGKLIGKYVADLNTHLENGWYYTDASTLNCPVNAGAIVEVSNRDNTIEVQTFWYWMGSGILIKVERLFNGTEWRPWEWVNPPMALGGIDADGNPINEYRTTERYMGHPVYVKLINFGSLPNADTRTAKALIAGTDVLVSIYGMATGSDGNKNIFPIMSDSGIVARFWFRANSGEIAVRTTDDRSGFTAIFWVKYYKTTD